MSAPRAQAGPRAGSESQPLTSAVASDGTVAKKQHVDDATTWGWIRWVMLGVLFIISTSNIMIRYFIVFLYAVPTETLTPERAAYESMKDDLGITGTQYGALTGPAFMSLFALATTVAGHVTDNYNRKHAIALGLAVWSTGTAIMGLSQNFWHVLGARAMQALGQGFCPPLAYSLLASYFDIQERGVANGIFSSGVYVGYAFSSLSLMLMPAIGWRHACYLVGGLSGSLLIFLFLIVREPPRPVKPAAPAAPAPAKPLLGYVPPAAHADADAGDTADAPDGDVVGNADLRGKRSLASRFPSVPSSVAQRDPESGRITRSLASFAWEDRVAARTSALGSVGVALHTTTMRLLLFAACMRLIGGLVFGSFLPVHLKRSFPDQKDEYAILNSIVVAVGGTLSAVVGGRICDAWSRRTTKTARDAVTGLRTAIEAGDDQAVARITAEMSKTPSHVAAGSSSSSGSSSSAGTARSRAGARFGAGSRAPPTTGSLNDALIPGVRTISSSSSGSGGRGRSSRAAAAAAAQVVTLTPPSSDAARALLLDRGGTFQPTAGPSTAAATVAAGPVAAAPVPRLARRHSRAGLSDMGLIVTDSDADEDDDAAALPPRAAHGVGKGSAAMAAGVMAFPTPRASPAPGQTGGAAGDAAEAVALRLSGLDAGAGSFPAARGGSPLLIDESIFQRDVLLLQDLVPFATISALSCVLSVPFTLGSVMFGSLHLSMGSLFFAYLLGESWFGPLFVIIANHANITPRVRGMAMALCVSVSGLFSSIGPLFVGVLDDYVGNMKLELVLGVMVPNCIAGLIFLVLACRLARYRRTRFDIARKRVLYAADLPFSDEDEE